MGFFRHTVRQLQYNGHENMSYGLYDTLLVSFSRYAEFRRIEAGKPLDERTRVIARTFIGHNEVFYADEYGCVSKFEIIGD